MENDSVTRQRVQELTWALLDEQITDDEMSLLDNLLLSDDAARQCYLECVQLHVDLMAHYATQTTPTAGDSRLPIVGDFSNVESFGFASPAEEPGN